MEIRSTEFFRNIKVLPTIGTKEFEDLLEWEEAKCKGGVNINGVFIPPWLYWHVNHWHIRDDEIDKYGNEVRKKKLPDLRDNEWIRAEAIERCKKEQKGYLEVGLRQGGKSEFEASYCGYNAILFENTQNVIVGGNDPDLSLLKDKVDFGLKNLWEGLSIPRLDKTWKGNQIRLGYKKSNGDDDIWSYLIIRNADDGKNTESAAGTTAKSYIMDEIGKYSFAKVFEAAKPALRSKFGWRAIPILVGTGGSFDKGADAERLFYHPEENNLLDFHDKETGKKTCLFMSGIYRHDQGCKTKTTLGDWLRDERGITVPPESELFNIEMWAADKERARTVINAERELKKRDPDQTEYLKVIMYSPLTPDECFMTVGDNIFNIEAAKRQQARVKESNITGTSVELFHDGEKIQHKFIDKKPIGQYPYKHSDDKDAPIVIWEFPVINPPHGLYTAGVDSYKDAQAKYSDSLGAVYIFKRVHSIFDEKFKNQIVASYVARPDDKKKWQEQARMLIKYYNARTLVENDELSFIDYMISKGDEQYLEPEPQYLKSLIKNSTVKKDFGIHRSAEAVRNMLHSTLKEYLETVVYTERDESGSVTKELTGVNYIYDIALLDEIIKYNEEDNFDRVVAAELAISLGVYLNRSIGNIGSTNSDPRLQSLYNKEKKGSTMFPEVRKMKGRGSSIKRLFG